MKWIELKSLLRQAAFALRFVAPSDSCFVWLNETNRTVRQKVRFCPQDSLDSADAEVVDVNFEAGWFGRPITNVAIETRNGRGRERGMSPPGEALMRILIAEDDAVSCRLLETDLARHGHEVVVTRNGSDALRALQEKAAPKLAVLDWMMPGMSGVEICAKVREQNSSQPPYLILLTARGSREDIVQGLNFGANDFVTKPFDFSELLARVCVGERVLGLQASLAARVSELEAALGQVKQLQGLLPICSYCKKIIKYSQT